MCLGRPHVPRLTDTDSSSRERRRGEREADRVRDNAAAARVRREAGNVYAFSSSLGVAGVPNQLPCWENYFIFMQL